MRDRLLPALLVAALLVFLQFRGGVELGALAMVAIALFAYVTLAGGRLLAIAAGIRDGDPSSAWVLGLIATCLAIYALTLALPLTAGGALGMISVVVVVLDFAFRKQALPPDPKALIGFALAVALTAAWCSAPASAYQVVREQGVLPLWVDYFFHGAVTSQLGDVRALGRGSIYLADHPPSFYHFASYGAAAAFARILDQPGLALAAAVWLPLGFLAMLCGGCALGTRLAGPAGGIAALAALALLPDASNYGLRNGWFSFHWTLFAHAGAAYALGAAFVSLALLDRWHAERSRPALIASVLLALSTLLFRAQVFALYVPAWMAAAAVCSVPRSKRRTAAWLMLAVLGIGAAGASLLIAQLGHWRLGAPALVDFLWYVHTGHEPTAYTGVYAGLRSMAEPGFLLAAGIALVFAAALGAFVVALPAAALVAREKGALRPIDAACGYLAFCWLLLVLFAPTPWHGDPSDFTHRSFVLLYAACALWTLCLVIRSVEKPLWPAMLTLALLALPALMVSADGLIRPKFRWGEAETHVPVAPGLVDAAAFMRRHAAAGDIFAAAGLSETVASYDLPTQLCALSGMPAYLSRPYFEMIKDAPRRELVTARLAALRKLEGLAEYPAAMDALGAMKVRWYVVAGGQAPRWDPDQARAAFRSGTVTLYRIP